MHHRILRTEDVCLAIMMCISLALGIEVQSRTRDEVTGPARLPKDKEKYLSLLKSIQYMGNTTAEAAKEPILE